jgi:hypothetical protein
MSGERFQNVEAKVSRKKSVQHVFEESREIRSGSRVDEVNAITVDDDVSWIILQVAHRNGIAVRLQAARAKTAELRGIKAY